VKYFIFIQPWIWNERKCLWTVHFLFWWCKKIVWKLGIGSNTSQQDCLLTYGAEPFLRSCQLCSHSGNSQQF
jgi:hypothetical protein